MHCNAMQCTAIHCTAMQCNGVEWSRAEWEWEWRNESLRRLVRSVVWARLSSARPLRAPPVSFMRACLPHLC